jgi:hypothetical protein
MQSGKAALVVRAVGNSALALAGVAAFTLAWTVADLSDGARRLISFGASLFFVVLFHEASASWRHLRDARRNGEGHV